MIIDARELETGSSLRTDVCIVGAGPAGISIARELDAAGIDVLALESGGEQADNETRDLSRGENVGFGPYDFADGARSRFLGGSSNCWGGWCRTMDEHDFERRSWVEGSGWPISKHDLDPYYRRSMGVLGLGPYDFDPASWVEPLGRHDVRRMPVGDHGFRDSISQISAPRRFGEEFGPELRRSPRLRLLLHANLVDIETDEEATTVRRVEVATLTGRRFFVEARVFVLATGGIENARLLLAANRVRPAGLGNDHDKVGRHFMEHPRTLSGWVRFADEWKGNLLYDDRYHYQHPAMVRDGTYFASQFSMTPEVQEREGLLNGLIWFSSIFPGEDTVEDPFIQLRRKLIKRDRAGEPVPSHVLKILKHPVDALGFLAFKAFRPAWLFKGVRMHIILEPPPNPESRITLADERDALGMPRVRVDWKLGDDVKRNFDAYARLFGEALGKSGVATVELDAPLAGREWTPGTVWREGTWHHMGTTRMADSPNDGVVDRNCKVHGISNLYCAGSSVFPTAGANFPTITLVALALRLSDHLKDAHT
jgi:choline dehydrogenase-like flavoprotein